MNSGIFFSANALTVLQIWLTFFFLQKVNQILKVLRVSTEKKKQIRTMIIFTTEKDCDTKLSLTTLLPFLSSKFHSILSFLSSLNHLASYLFKGSSHIVRRKGKCVETYKIHKLYKIKTPLFLPRCWWWGSCSSPPMMLMTNMIHNDGDDHLTY